MILIPQFKTDCHLSAFNMVKSLATLALALMAFTATPGSAVEVQMPQPYPPGSAEPPGYAQVFSETGCNGPALWPNARVNVDKNCGVCWTPSDTFNSISLAYSNGEESQDQTIACHLFPGVNCSMPDTELLHTVRIPDGAPSQCLNVEDGSTSMRSIQCCAFNCGPEC
jgi:hypothetical protein